MNRMSATNAGEAMRYVRWSVILVAIMLIAYAAVRITTSKGPNRPVTEDGVPAFLGSDARIVSLAPSVTEIICAIGGFRNLVGVTEQCNYPPEISGVPRIGSMVSPSMELILQCRPDVVIATRTGGNRLETGEKLRNAGIPLLAIADSTIDELNAATSRIGDLLGMRMTAYKLTQNLDAAVSELSTLCKEFGDRKVLWVVSHDPVYVAGTGTLYDDVLIKIGLKNSTTMKGYRELSSEMLLSNAPDFIFDISGSAPGWWGERFPALPGMTTVLCLDSDTFSRPGPRFSGALRSLHDKLVRATEGIGAK